jgi:hypothetical protein
MPLPRRYLLLVACFGFHLALVGLVSIHETLWLLDQHLTVAGNTFAAGWRELDKLPAAILGNGSSAGNPLRQALATYTNATGIEAGYGYFAPNVPAAHALIFECRYSDGRVGYEAPSVRGAEAQLRLTSLIDQIGRSDSPAWRNALVRMLAGSTWRRHPDAVAMRAFFGATVPPTASAYRAGRREWAFDCLYVFDFDREKSQETTRPP